MLLEEKEKKKHHFSTKNWTSATTEGTRTRRTADWGEAGCGKLLGRATNV